MLSYPELAEAEIIERIVEGDKSLYEIIVRRFNPFLYKIGRSYNYSHEDTQDLMQDTFIDAYKNLAHFKGGSTFKTWITRIMMNNCFHKKEKANFKNEVIQDIPDNSKPMFQHSNNDTYKIVESHEMRHIIEDALEKIPEDYRLVFFAQRNQ